MPETSSFINLIVVEAIKRIRNNVKEIVNRKAIARESELFREATRLFNNGDLDASINCYKQIKLDPYKSQMAHKMLGWISYSRGNLEKGWPVFPVTSIDRVQIIEFLTAYFKSIFSGAIRIPKAARPWELKYLLKLQEWQPESRPKLGLLIWFNFGSSLGGEILCGKLLGEFIESHESTPVTCAIDARLVEFFQSTYPSVTFISKKDYLPIRNRNYDYFLLGRDLLGLFVRSEQDFLPIKSRRFIPPGRQARWNGTERIFKVAISWKTTNLEQGKYRNIPLVLLVEVLKKYPFSYFSAQHGMTEEEKSYLSKELGDLIDFGFFNPAGSISDFCSSLKEMDLILSIDNSTMHIAGSIGVETYGLLSIPSYWAYPASGPDSRWYDTVHLIRQSAPGEWLAVMNELDEKLETTYRTCGYYISTTS